MIDVNEPAFGVNSFNKPKVLNESQSLATSVLMILFGKPGFYPSIPELGMDISQYIYQFEENVNVEAIKSKLAYQCSLVKDLIINGTMTVEQKVYNEKPLLLITVPMEIYNTNNELIIGVTTNNSGSVIYNFKLIDSNF